MEISALSHKLYDLTRETELAARLVPDSLLLPSQLPSRQPADQPLHRLWLACVDIALQDLSAISSSSGHRWRLRHAAEAWIADHSHHVGSFTWICELFGIDPDVFRRRLGQPCAAPR